MARPQRVMAKVAQAAVLALRAMAALVVQLHRALMVVLAEVDAVAALQEVRRELLVTREARAVTTTLPLVAGRALPAVPLRVAR
ncbi:MAG: hypothetical protein HRJ53_01970, partial [Acidobacteria bacterium Pan2503]|nr:hypothetical protein [Candidatus Acidoferrum panamensis]